MKGLRRMITASACVLLAGVVFCVIINIVISNRAAGAIYADISDVPANEEPRTAVVFGAGVKPDGQPSHTLYDRVVTAVELYQAGRVNRFIMSGGRVNEIQDEPIAMKNLAVQLGVPEEIIDLDGEGNRTSDSCNRAANVFGVKRAVLVTQDYHLPRSVFLCRNAGIDVIGIISNKRIYNSERMFRIREFFSTANAWLESLS